jgi:hypothetical protein
MAWTWILGRLGSGRQGTGLFGYLAARDQNKTRIKLENARREATREIIDHLPGGAVFREGTPDGWREILMPHASQPQLLAFPAGRAETAQGRPGPTVDPQPAILDSDDEQRRPAGIPQLPPSQSATPAGGNADRHRRVNP